MRKQTRRRAARVFLAAFVLGSSAIGYVTMWDRIQGARVQAAEVGRKCMTGQRNAMLETCFAVCEVNYGILTEGACRRAASREGKYMQAVWESLED